MHMQLLMHNIPKSTLRRSISILFIANVMRWELTRVRRQLIYEKVALYIYIYIVEEKSRGGAYIYV